MRRDGTMVAGGASGWMSTAAAAAKAKWPILVVRSRMTRLRHATVRCEQARFESTTPGHRQNRDDVPGQSSLRVRHRSELGPTLLRASARARGTAATSASSLTRCAEAPLINCWSRLRESRSLSCRVSSWTAASCRAACGFQELPANPRATSSCCSRYLPEPPSCRISCP